MATIQKTSLKRFNGVDWDLVHLASSGDIIRVGADITVMGNGIGSFKPGEVIGAADSVQEIIRKMVQTRIPATYTDPTLSVSIVSGTSKGSYEAGTPVSATIRSTFSQNDAGLLTGHAIKLNGSSMINGVMNPAEYSYVATLGDETVSISSVAEYSAGPMKSDNLGDPSPIGSITAGSKTAGGISYTGIRKGFHGSDPLGIQGPRATSAEIRGLTSTTPGAVFKGQVITAVVPIGSTRFTLAFPSGVGLLAEVLYKEAGNANITSQLSLTTVSVHGVNGFTAVPYNVYTISWPQPTVGAMTFTITI